MNIHMMFERKVGWLKNCKSLLIMKSVYFLVYVLLIFSKSFLQIRPDSFQFFSIKSVRIYEPNKWIIISLIFSFHIFFFSSKVDLFYYSVKQQKKNRIYSLLQKIVATKSEIHNETHPPKLYSINSCLECFTICQDACITTTHAR